MNSFNRTLSRRRFLRSGAGTVGMSAGMLAALRSLQDLQAATSQQSDLTDYKALVCIFLFGGNDSANMVIPNDATGYSEYSTARGILALPQTDLRPISVANDTGRDWAFHPNFGDPLNPTANNIDKLFADGKCAVIANVGTLVVPTTREQYLAGAVPLPPQLFSHNNQQVQWMTSTPSQQAAIGWGGRMADCLKSLNENSQISMSISLAGNNVFQVGREVLQYQVDRNNGSISLSGFNPGAGGTNGERSRAFESIINRSHGHLFEQANADVMKRAIAADAIISGELSALDAQGLAAFNDDDDATAPGPWANNSLADQLRMVAKMIAIAPALQQKRQIFFCAQGGFDTHGDQLADHNNLLGVVNDSMRSFYDCLKELEGAGGFDTSLASKVTAFTSSDFGRTFVSNGKGSDHGWGGQQLVIGDAVNGGDFFGTMPQYIVNGPDDTSRGRWLPSTATDEFAATLAKWFGVPSAEIPMVLPNIGEFPSTDLGFMQPG